MPKHTAVRIPDDVYAAVEKHVQLTGEDKSSLIVRSLRKELGIATEEDKMLPYERYVQEAIAPLKAELEELRAEIRICKSKSAA
jgi:virulence-associated protein VagC